MRSRKSAFRPAPPVVAAVAALTMLLVAAACGADGPGRRAGAGSATTKAPTALRLGYFPNVTHATALVGVESGIFEAALGPHTLEARTFAAGPAAVEALFSGGLDAAYLGPNPAVNAHVQSEGRAVRIVSGATSGGVLLVVKPSITTPADLRGKTLATPQRGGTQDVALRSWLKSNDLTADLQGGGDVSILPQENAQSLETFRSGHIDGAWVPEPWATRIVQEGGGRVLVDERALWPGGRFVTTHLVVRTEFLENHPDAVRRLLEGQVQANELVNGDPAEARRLVNRRIAAVTGKGLPEAVLQASWDNLEFTNDPVASSLAVSAGRARDLGFLRTLDLGGIYDLTLLDQVLATFDQPQGKG